MGVVLAMHLTGTAFQAAQMISQANLLTATATSGDSAKTAGFPEGCEIRSGVCALITSLTAAGFRLSPAEVAFACLRNF